eukprot:6671512-Lingulodinium_polyedra.AAC.1
MNLPQALWEALAPIAGTTWQRLQSECVHEGHLSFHFIWRRVLEPAPQLPWSLCRGDQAANLQELKEGDCPEDPVCSQLWQLMQAGLVSQRQLLQT